MTPTTRLARALLPLALTAGLPLAAAAPAAAQGGHDHHHHEAQAPQAAQPPQAMAAAQAELSPELRIKRVLDIVPDFKGVLTFDPGSRRLFLVSFGPPANTKGPSILYELDPETGKVLRQAQMPFLGELASPVYVDGVLYQGIDYQAKVYKVEARPDRQFGQILGELRLPGMQEIGYDPEEVFRFPFISFKGMSRTQDGKLLIHAQHLGEFLVVDPADGRIVRRTPTIKGLAGIATLPGPHGRTLVLASSDPAQAEFEGGVHRFMYRAAHGGPPRPGARQLLWMLLDADTGEALASLESRDSLLQAGALALLRHEPVEGTPYGRFTFLTSGQDGLLEIEWSPRRGI